MPEYFSEYGTKVMTFIHSLDRFWLLDCVKYTFLWYKMMLTSILVTFIYAPDACLALIKKKNFNGEHAG